MIQQPPKKTQIIKHLPNKKLIQQGRQQDQVEGRIRMRKRESIRGYRPLGVVRAIEAVCLVELIPFIDRCNMPLTPFDTGAVDIHSRVPDIEFPQLLVFCEGARDPATATPNVENASAAVKQAHRRNSFRNTVPTRSKPRAPPTKARSE
jgi:hypothetical protein